MSVRLGRAVGLRRRRYNRPPMPVVDPLAQRPIPTGADGDSPEPRGASFARSLRRWLRSWPVIWVLACVAAAALSAALLPTIPSYDPWSWIVWGREVFDSHLSFVV